MQSSKCLRASKGLICLNLSIPKDGKDGDTWLTIWGHMVTKALPPPAPGPSWHVMPSSAGALGLDVPRILLVVPDVA